MAAPSETEVKLRIRDRDALRARLRALGAALVRERHFEDNLLLDDAQGSLRLQGCVLRLRRTAHGGTMTFKGPRTLQGGMKTREEREIAVEDPDALEGILTRLGYRPVFRYQKYRESWRCRSQSVEVDDTPIGAFLEIEGDPDGITALAAELGFEREEYVSDSYVALFLAQGGQGDMVFEPSRS